MEMSTGRLFDTQSHLNKGKEVVVDHHSNFQFGQVSTANLGTIHFTHFKDHKQWGFGHLKVPAIVQVHEDGRFAAVVHHRNFGCHLQVGSPNLLGVPEEHEVAQAVAVFSHWVKGVGCLDDIQLCQGIKIVYFLP